RADEDVRRILWDLDRLALFCRPVTHLRGALQLVPGETLALNRALQGLKQHHREQLAISKSLQPNLAEQPNILASFRFAAFECEGDGRSKKINHQERSEKQHQPLKARWIRGFRVIELLNEIPNRTDRKHQINKRRDQRQNNLENEDIRQCYPAQYTLSTECRTMLPY